MSVTPISIVESPIAPWLAGESFADIRKKFDAQGYVIFENVLSDETVDQLKQALTPFLDANISGRNDFEGLKTNRVYAMLNKNSLFADLVTHPLALAFAEADLGRSCLLSACLAIRLHPGESVQPWHYDDGHIELPRPRPSCGISTFWTMDATTEDNGATEILPGSHLWPEQDINGALKSSDFSNRAIREPQDDPAYNAATVKAVMPAGSLMICKGTLWHRGGANRSDTSRLIITPQYCPGWARPLENMLLAVSPEHAAQLPQRAQELLGYSIHPPFMGYVDGMHPKRALPSHKT